MPISMDRVVLQPGVAVIARMMMINQGVEDAVDLSGAEDAAEKSGTPLNELIARINERDEHAGGNGDDLAEFAGRQCYRSWEKGRDNASYISNVIDMGHGSVFEHASVAFQVTGVSRSLTHELIRHRVGTAFSQESQRYVDAKDLRFVVPPLLADRALEMTEGERENDDELTIFRRSCHRSLNDYAELQQKFNDRLVSSNYSPKSATAAKKRANEAARALLPNAAETRLVFTTNLRAIRHITSLRGTEFADLEIRRLVIALLECARDYAPNFFADAQAVLGDDAIPALRTGTGRV